MTLLAAVDPGLCAGVAIVDTSNWTWEVGILGDRWWEKLSHVHMAVIEKPVIYPKSKARPNDIITLALRAGEVGGAFGAYGVPVRYVQPHEWKRTLPKPICHERIKGRLSSAEWLQIDAVASLLPDTKRHNLLDAVGLAMWGCSRFVY